MEVTAAVAWWVLFASICAASSTQMLRCLCTVVHAAQRVATSGPDALLECLGRHASTVSSTASRSAKSTSTGPQNPSEMPYRSTNIIARFSRGDASSWLGSRQVPLPVCRSPHPASISAVRVSRDCAPVEQSGRLAVVRRQAWERGIAAPGHKVHAGNEGSASRATSVHSFGVQTLGRSGDSSESGSTSSGSISAGSSTSRASSGRTSSSSSASTSRPQTSEPGPPTPPSAGAGEEPAGGASDAPDAANRWRDLLQGINLQADHEHLRLLQTQEPGSRSLVVLQVRDLTCCKHDMLLENRFQGV